MIWLSVLTSFDRAINVGLVPSVAATFAKTLLAAVTLPSAWRIVDKLRG